MKSQRTLSNLGMMASSLDNKTIEDSYIKTKSRYETKPLVKKSKSKSKLTHLKHSMSSGSFNKIKTFESSCLKQTKTKNSRKFIIERKQINLQSNSREASKTREKSRPLSKHRIHQPNK